MRYTPTAETLAMGLLLLPYDPELKIGRATVALAEFGLPPPEASPSGVPTLPAASRR